MTTNYVLFARRVVGNFESGTVAFTLHFHTKLKFMRFSMFLGLTSPSYDDLMYDRLHGTQQQYDSTALQSPIAPNPLYKCVATAGVLNNVLSFARM